MKQIFFSLFFATLAYTAFAQYKVTVSSTSGSYSMSKTVSFNVSWTNRLEGKYNSKVWILIDYSVPGSGVWSRATVTAVNAGSSGSTVTAGGRGFWLQGNSGAYSQKVTVTLSGVPAKFNWCAHVSDCPPNVTVASGGYTFHGTPPFTLIASNGITKQIVTGKTLSAASLTIAPTTLTDATDCPGVFCIYNGNDLYIDATHLCQLRSTGAKNWEAWIKDSRDANLYRIVQLPTSVGNQWWMAEDLRLATTGEVWCSPPPLVGRFYTVAQAQTVCPTGWRLPSEAELNRLRDNFGMPALKLTGATYWGDGTSHPAYSAADGTDTYGFSLHGYGGRYQGLTAPIYCRRNAMIVDQTGIWSWGCYATVGYNCPVCGTGYNICFSGGNDSNMTTGIVRCIGN